MDGLRAVAAVLVVAYHVSLSAGHTGDGNGFADSGALAPALAQLKVGVTIFFVISGLVLYLPFARALVDGSEMPNWRLYARRRLVRIVPAYWVALLATGFLFPDSGTFGAPGLRLLMFAQIYHANTIFSGVGVAWSLDVEVMFYMMVPLLAVGVGHLLSGRSRACSVRAQLTILGGIGGGAFLGRMMLSGGSLGTPAGSIVAATSPFLLLGWFVPGMMLAVLIAGREAGRPVPRLVALLARRPELSLLLSLCAFVAAIPTEHGDLFLTLYAPITQLLLGMCAAMLVLPVALRTDRSPSAVIAVLDSRVLTAVGTVSYGIYLWHLPLLLWLRGPVSRTAGSLPLPATCGVFVLVLGGAFVLATVSWRLIERPLGRWERRSERAVRRVTPLHQTMP